MLRDLKTLFFKSQYHNCTCTIYVCTCARGVSWIITVYSMICVYECVYCVYTYDSFSLIYLVCVLFDRSRAQRGYLEKCSNYKVVTADGGGEYKSTAALRFYFWRRKRQARPARSPQPSIHALMCTRVTLYYALPSSESVLQIASSHSDKLNNSPWPFARGCGGDGIWWGRTRWRPLCSA